MKITVSQLRRIIKEEIEKVTVHDVARKYVDFCVRSLGNDERTDWIVANKAAVEDMVKTASPEALEVLSSRFPNKSWPNILKTSLKKDDEELRAELTRSPKMNSVLYVLAKGVLGEEV